MDRTSDLESASELATDLRAARRARADAAKAGPMQAYMKSEMPFLGVQSGPRKEIERAHRGAIRALDASQWRALVRELWDAAAFREERYIALAVVRTRAKDLAREDLDWLQALVIDGGWWDWVDEIASQILSPWVRREPELLEVMDAWVTHPSFWVRRVAMLCQLKCKQDTDRARLFAYAMRLSDEDEFFVRKAIGWALRQYAYVDASAVRDFVLHNEERFCGLTVREALKNIGRV